MTERPTQGVSHLPIITIHTHTQLTHTSSQILFDKFDREGQHKAFLTLKSSPVNAVTLPPESRVKAHIPLHAAFYSFCYPHPLKKGFSYETLEVRINCVLLMIDMCVCVYVCVYVCMYVCMWMMKRKCAYCLPLRL